MSLSTPFCIDIPNWGDYQYDIDYAAGLIPPFVSVLSPVAAPEPKPELIEPDWEADVLAGWSAPNLGLRKNLWEHFPIDVLLKDTDATARHRGGVGSRARYIVRWNEAKLEEWRHTHPNSWDEYQEYEAWCRFRLADALATYCDKYTVEESLEHLGDGSICVLSMAAEPPRIVRTGPRALDVLRKYPISWDRDGNIHRIKLHRVNARTLGVKENDVTFDLLGALAACTDCVVTPASGSGYMMTVTLI